MLRTPLSPLPPLQGRDNCATQWTAAENVLMDPQNITVIDAIYCRLDLGSVIAISRTSSRGRISWLTYKGRTFNIMKLLSNYFIDPAGFRNMQRKTGAAIFGEVPMRYFSRCCNASAVFDIAANAIHITYIIRHLLSIEGFRIWDGDQWVDEVDSVDKELQCLRRSHSLVPRPGHNDTEGNRSQPADRLLLPNAICGRPLLFERKSSSGRLYGVRVWITNKGACDLVLQSKTSQYSDICNHHRP